MNLNERIYWAVVMGMWCYSYCNLGFNNDKRNEKTVYSKYELLTYRYQQPATSTGYNIIHIVSWPIVTGFMVGRLPQCTMFHLFQFVFIIERKIKVKITRICYRKACYILCTRTSSHYFMSTKKLKVLLLIH